MEISTNGLATIGDFEGCKLEAYKCPAGIWTIGYGHTKGVKEGDRITQQEAIWLLRDDLRWVQNAIDKHVTAKLNQGQYDALASFIFNVGEFAFASSTLLKKLNAGDYAGAANEFLRWTKAKGRELPGLVRRRQHEKELFLA